MIEQASRKVMMSPELMDSLFTRDRMGRRLRIEWGTPDLGGYYNPTIHVEEDEFSRTVATTTKLVEAVEEWNRVCRMKHRGRVAALEAVAAIRTLKTDGSRSTND